MLLENKNLKKGKINKLPKWRKQWIGESGDDMINNLSSELQSEAKVKKMWRVCEKITKKMQIFHFGDFKKMGKWLFFIILIFLYWKAVLCDTSSFKYVSPILLDQQLE